MSHSSDESIPDYLAGLNDAQREAATYGIGSEQELGPLLVIAGAGTGKTNSNDAQGRIDLAARMRGMWT